MILIENAEISTSSNKEWLAAINIYIYEYKSYILDDIFFLSKFFVYVGMETNSEKTTHTTLFYKNLLNGS
jgi:hypothetical protein